MDPKVAVIIGGSLITCAFLIGFAVQKGLEHGCTTLAIAIQAGMIAHGEAIQTGLEYHPLFIKEQFK
jgi:hypothetical protein